jgi:hypothetical protein
MDSGTAVALSSQPNGGENMSGDAVAQRLMFPPQKRERRWREAKETMGDGRA